jgi:hypothetical protein
MLRLRPRHASPDGRRTGVVAGVWIVALRLALLPNEALAVEPCPSRESWVRVDVQGAAPDFARRVLEDLRAGLAGSRVGACADDLAGKPPLAVVRVVPSRDEPTRYAIDVSDAVTRKRLVRDVDLRRVPPDGRAFAIAVAAEELLRASWAELELRDRKREPPAPSEAPLQAPSREAPPPPSRSNGDALGARFALEHYAHGQTQVGGDISWSRPLVSSIGFTFALGLRKGLDTDSEHGRVESSAFGAELALESRLVSFGAVSLQLPVALRGVRVTFSGRAADGAIAREHSGFALFARGGLSLVVAPGGAFRARTSAGAGAPLRSFSASDAGERITGLGGLELFAHTGVAVEF